MLEARAQGEWTNKRGCAASAMLGDAVWRYSSGVDRDKRVETADDPSLFYARSIKKKNAPRCT